MSADIADQLLLIDSQGSDRCFAFGLSWFALIGSHVRAVARTRARRLKATHYVIAGAGAAAAGCARLPVHVRRRPVHAAAQVFAHQYPEGTSACVVALPDGVWWLGAAQDGAVLTRGDKIYADAGQATAALDALAAQYSSLRQVDGAQVLAAMMASTDAATLMLPVESRWARLPGPVRAFMVLLVMAFALPFGWQAWQQRPSRSVSDASAFDTDEAWRDAIAQFRVDQSIHLLPELNRVVTSLYLLPLNARGWLLNEARCLPARREWVCAAKYVRSSGDAANDDFQQALPDGWRVQFEPLDDAELHWRVSGNGHSLNDAPLLGAKHMTHNVVSALQRARPAFDRVALGSAVAVPIVVHDAQGKVVDWPARPVIYQHALVLQGPLRSLALLKEIPMVASWSSLVLRLVAGRVPDVAVSALTVELQGVLYEEH